MKKFLLLPSDFFRIPNMTGFDRAVLSELLQHDMRGDGVVFPSQARIAKALTSTRASVSRSIQHLESKGHITKAKRDGRSNEYQISGRFLVDSLLRRPARSDTRRQPELLLPIKSSGEPLPPTSTVTNRTTIGPPTVTSSTTIERPRTRLNLTTTRLKLSPGKRKNEGKNPSSSTGLVAARESKEILNSATRRAARAGPNFADPAVRRAKWMSDCIEWMTGNWPTAEVKAAMEVIVGEPESAAAKQLLERASAERRQRRSHAAGGESR